MSYDGCYGLKGLPLLAQRSWRYPDFEELRIPRPVPNTIGAISLLVAKHRNVEEGEKSQTKVIAIPVMNGKLVVRINASFHWTTVPVKSRATIRFAYAVPKGLRPFLINVYPALKAGLSSLVPQCSTTALTEQH